MTETERIRRTWWRTFGFDVEAARFRDSRLSEKIKPLSAHLKMLSNWIKEEPGCRRALKKEREGAIHEATERPVTIVSHETDSQSTSTSNRLTRQKDKTVGIKKSDAFPKKYIKVEDLGGRKVAAVIDRVEMEEVGDQDKPVVYFENDSVKPLVLNNTNWSTIEEIADDEDTDNWSGVKILLSPAKTNYQGNRVPSIRIEAAPKPAKPSREPGEDDGDEAA